MSKRHRKLRLESMEARNLMAGDIAAYMVGGNLHLDEAAGQAGAANSVRVSQLDDGRIRIEGNSTADGSVSLINGAAFQDFSVPGNLYVRFGGGDDLVAFFNEPTFNEIHIDVAAPEPVFTPYAAYRFAGSGLMPTDNDDVILWAFQTHSHVTINSGAGDDWIFVSDSIVGTSYDLAANLTINSGAGSDVVQVESNMGTMQVTGTIDVQTYRNINENNADTVWLERVQAFDDIRIRTGAGNDGIYMMTAFIRDDVEIDAGAGNDQATLDSVVAIDGLMARMGEGDDTLTTKGLWAELLSLSGDGGFDTLKKSVDEHIGQRVETGWEAINPTKWGNIVWQGAANAVYAQN